LADFVAELEADLAAARTSLRTVVRQTNRTEANPETDRTPSAAEPATGACERSVAITSIRALPPAQETDHDGR
jgi:hypothetical protein